MNKDKSVLVNKNIDIQKKKKNEKCERDESIEPLNYNKGSPLNDDHSLKYNT